MTPQESPIDYERLFKLRLTVARGGDMDNARWWNTKVLSANGAWVFRRGFPRTYPFAQARAAFAVAAARCREWYDVPGALTLWDLGVEVEERWEDAWQEWLDDVDRWHPFFKRLGEVQPGGLLAALQELDLVDEAAVGAVQRLKYTGEARGVELPAQRSLDDATVTLLAGAFGRGEPGRLAVPFVSIQA